MTTHIPAIAAALLLASAVPPADARPGEQGLRVATFNIHDARTPAMASGDDDRLKRIARVILDIRPDIILLNEIDQDAECRNAQRFADNYLARAQSDADAIRYRAFMRASNTGVHSGYDLDKNGVNDPGASPRDFGGDCLGYGEYPGQYAMALLVREGLTIDEPRARTFRHLLWKDMPGALLPPGPDGVGAWYTDKELAVLPLSSKSHWDVPVILENGATVHILASHPTPPVFDGPEDRNGRRNHDEIRFWADYIAGGDAAAYIADDAGTPGGLDRDALFVIVGDLNADPDAGDSRGRPTRLLLDCPRVQADPAPAATITRTATRGGRQFTLSDTATSRFGLRIDYALPSTGMTIAGAQVYATLPQSGPEPVPHAPDAAPEFPSDHFPVVVDLLVPPPGTGQDATIPAIPPDKNP